MPQRLFIAAIALTALAASPAPAQPQGAAPPAPTARAFTAAEHASLRQLWRTDRLIREHVEPGDEAAHDRTSSFYAEDDTAGLSLAPVAPPPAPPAPAIAAATPATGRLSFGRRE